MSKQSKNGSNVVFWDPNWKDQLEWVREPELAPEVWDDLVDRLADGPAEMYGVVVQPLSWKGAPGLSLRVISVNNPDDDLILNFVCHESATWGTTIDRLRKTFHRQIFERLSAALRLEVAMQTNPELQTVGPARTRLRDELARHFEATLTDQLEVKRPGRTARSTAADRRALLVRYHACFRAVKTGEGLPDRYARLLSKPGHQDPWKIALQWAAKEQGLKYKPSYLEKIFTKAKSENPELANHDQACANSTLEQPHSLSVAK